MLKWNAWSVSEITIDAVSSVLGISSRRREMSICTSSISSSSS